MNRFLKTTFIAVSLVLVAGFPAGAQVLSRQMNWDKLAAKAAEVVDVNVDSNMLQLAAKFLSNKDPDEARVKKMIGGLKGIFVKSFQFEKEGEYAESDVEAIRAQLVPPVWSRMIGIRSKREGENAEIFTRMDGDQVVGLAIVATGPKELTIVDIGGNIDLAELSELGGHFGVPKLELEKQRKGGTR